MYGKDAEQQAILQVPTAANCPGQLPGQIVANEYRPGPVLAGLWLEEELRAKRREYRWQLICETEAN